ncbi:Protein-disulfide isomerase [Granulicella rosea]|uniref:Protein-disulfide isomerase n=1 Tax=Granulicella rosea TaxID=474952 RepID=A0A239GTA4_9BACT|nr:thioredoxin domain-containing protein [Granulicella rosea]SNS72018.1 Protein-disulfide isomerase [Granulicella rosea]
MSRLSISITPDDHIRGNPAAACSLVEFGDYECPSCGQIEPVLQKLQKHFGDRLSFVFRNFPLSETHAWAEAAAETAEFAASQGKFWEMHDLLFEYQSILSGDTLLELATRVGESSAALSTALQGGLYQERVRLDLEAGIRSGVNGTPTLFIDDRRYDGSFDSDSLTDAIDRALAEVKDADEL